MAEKSTFIKLDRNILQWRWYQDANTMRVFLHLLLTANIKQHDFKTDKIKRGSLATSIGHIAKSVGISYSQARTALDHLKETNEIAITKRPKYLVISITNYDKYQDKPTQNASKSQASRTQVASKSQQSKNIRIKEYPNGYIYPTRADLRSYVLEEGLAADPDEIFDYYEALGWEINGKPVKDWRAVCRRWKQYGRKEDEATMSEAEREAELHRLLDIMEQGGNIYDQTGS